MVHFEGRGSGCRAVQRILFGRDQFMISIDDFFPRMTIVPRGNEDLLLIRFGLVLEGGAVLWRRKNAKECGGLSE